MITSISALLDMQKTTNYLQIGSQQNNTYNQSKLGLVLGLGPNTYCLCHNLLVSHT